MSTPTPPDFVTVDPVALEAEAKAYYEQYSGVTLNPASVEWVMLKTVIYLLINQRSGLQDAAEQGLVDFAVGPALDYHAARFGINRLAADSATTTIEFTLVSGHTGVTIPSGTRVASTDGGAVFETVEDKSVATGILTATVTAECQQLGTSGNGYAIGTITNIQDPQPFITAASNTTLTGGGSTEESDTALRTRIKLAVDDFSTAGSVGSYRFHALSASASIIDVGVVLSQPGQVDIYPLMEDGSTPSATILQQVNDALNDETVRPLSDTVVVAAPTAVAFSVTVDLELFTGANGAAIQTAVQTAIEEYATSKRAKLGQDIIDSQLVAAAMGASTDIYDANLSGWTNVTISETEFGLLGTVTVNVTGYTNG